jgi:DNA-nicking Smr family endonuclease
MKLIGEIYKSYIKQDDNMRIEESAHDNDDLAAFHAAVSDARPLPPTGRYHFTPPPPLPRPKQRILDERAALHESLHGDIELQDRLEGGDEAAYLRQGLSRQILKDLRRGRWVIDAGIDLHGLNRHEAREQLSLFLAHCLKQGQRCIRIIHGRGFGSPGRQSVLRILVRNWLAQRKETLAYCQAPANDGGEGAMWVLLHAHK